MAITPAGDVFVADGYGNVPAWSTSDKEREIPSSRGASVFGTEPGEFSLPHAIALDSRGRLYVADRNNVRIQVFDQDGKFLDQWWDLVVPCAFWMTKDDELWVCGSSPMPWRADDKVLGYPPVNQLFMKFNTSGKLLQLWAVPLGEEGKERLGDLDSAHGLPWTRREISTRWTSRAGGHKSSYLRARHASPTIILTPPCREKCFGKLPLPAITMEGLLNGKGDLDDNIRMLKSTGAKFIGRSLCLWAGEANLLQNLARAKMQVGFLLLLDPDMISASLHL